MFYSVDTLEVNLHLLALNVLLLKYDMFVKSELNS